MFRLLSGKEDKGLSLISWIAEKLGTASVPLAPDSSLIVEYYSIFGEVCFRELAYAAAKNLIANSISKCEFKTMLRGEEVKQDEYYLWNVEPNKNENSSRFLRKIVNRLCDNNECLVIEQGGQLLVADSFYKQDYTLYEDVFSQVTVGELTFARQYRQHEVLYWKLSDKNIKQALEMLNGSYSKMLAYAMQAYQRSRGVKATLDYEAIPTDVKKEEQNQWILAQTKKYIPFLEADNAIMPQGKGVKLNAFGRSTSFSTETTRDIRAMIGDIFDFTALAFGIPPVLLRGDVQGTSDATDNLLTFAIDPWTDILREEIVRKRIGKPEHLRGTDLIIDASQVKHIDIMSASTQIDKLIGSGAFSVNDILKMLGRPTIKEPWADQHYITKNYALIEEVLKALTGGGENK